MIIRQWLIYISTLLVLSRRFWEKLHGIFFDILDSTWSSVVRFYHVKSIREDSRALSIHDSMIPTMQNEEAQEREKTKILIVLTKDDTEFKKKIKLSSISYVENTITFSNSIEKNSNYCYNYCLCACMYVYSFNIQFVSFLFWIIINIKNLNFTNFQRSQYILFRK